MTGTYKDLYSETKNEVFLCGTMLRAVKRSYRIVNYESIETLKSDYTAIFPKKEYSNSYYNMHRRRLIKEIITYYLNKNYDIKRINKYKYLMYGEERNKNIRGLSI